jgi:hypothetical protein
VPNIEQLQAEADRRNFSKIRRQRDPAKLLPAYWCVVDGKLRLIRRGGTTQRPRSRQESAAQWMAVARGEA